METNKKWNTFLSSEMGKKGSFLAVAGAAGVGDKELKWRRFLSESPILPIETLENTHSTHITEIQSFIICPNYHQNTTINKNSKSKPNQNPNSNPSSEPKTLKKIQRRRRKIWRFSRCFRSFSSLCYFDS